MSRMKRALEDYVEDTMRYWFPDGVGRLSKEEELLWRERAEVAVATLLDSYENKADNSK